MYLPELLPKFIALFEGAARRDGYEQASSFLEPWQRACFEWCTGGPMVCKHASCQIFIVELLLTWALPFQVELQTDLFLGSFHCRPNADRGTSPWVVATASEQTLTPLSVGSFPQKSAIAKHRAHLGMRVYSAEQQAPACRSRER